MPSTLNREDDIRTILSELDSLINYSRSTQSLLGVYIPVKFTTDAAADDTTIYTVPSGRVLYVYMYAGNQNVNLTNYVAVYDNTGDSATGKYLWTMPITEGHSGHYQTKLTKPIAVKNGITLKGSDMENSKQYNIELYGFLI